MTNWHSFVPFSYKKSSVVSMIQRALSVCSTYSLLAAELDRIRTICQQNDYPAAFIDTRIGIGLSKYLERKKGDTPALPVSGCEKRRMFIEIPYVGERTQSLKEQISQLVAEARPDLDVRYVAKPPPSVKTLFPTKDPVPKHLQSDVVYAAKCIDCKATYVGKTERQCSRRLGEHGAPKGTFDRHPGADTDPGTAALTTNPTPPDRITRRTRAEAQQQQPTRQSSRIRKRAEAVASRPPNQKNEEQIPRTAAERSKDVKTDAVLSSLAEHEKSTGHHIDWQNVRVLWRDNISYRLLVKESLVIRAHEPALNRTTHSVPLLIFPEGLERTHVPDPNG